MRGVQESAGANNPMVIIKIAAILIFVVGAARAVNTDNWHPFMPNGFPGVMTGAAIVFFTYIGFDSVSTAAEECKTPQRDLPFGIIVSLIVCTILYVSVALVLTGIANWKTLNNAAPVANALKALGFDTIRKWVDFGALVGMISSLLVFQYGQARVWFAMSRDRLLPDTFSRVHPRFQTPHVSTIVAGICCRHTRGDLLDIGTLRRPFEYRHSVRLHHRLGRRVAASQDPAGTPRGFNVPLVPLLPIFSIVCCVILMTSLPLETWVRFFVWLAIGLVIYFVYGKRRTEAA